VATVRSIIDVDVKSDSFQEFQKQFERFQAALKAMPADWSKASAGAAKFSQVHYQDMVAATAALQNAVRQQGELSRGASTADRMFKGVARTTGDILKNVTDVTFQLVKWGAFGGILGIAAGGFGAGALAGAGADIRRTSNSYGVSPGQLRAARAIYGPQLDADALLSNIAGAQSDLSKRWSFSALGITGARANQSPGDLLPEVIAGVVEKFRQSGGTQQGFNGLGLNNFMDINTARELSRLPAGELQREAGQYGAASKTLGLDDSTLERLKNLNQAFDMAKQRIESVLINGLDRLAVPLGNLSDSIVRALETFMNNPKMGEYIDSFGRSIEDVAKYLASSSFKNDINDFVNLIHKAAHPFDTVSTVSIPWSGSDTGGTSLKDVGEYWGGKAANVRDAVTGIFHMQGQWNKEQKLSLLEKEYGLPAGVLDKIWLAESSRGANAKSHDDIFGDFQTKISSGRPYGITPDSGWDEQASGTAKMYRDLLKYYGGDSRKALAAYFDGQGNLDKIIAKHPTDWADNLPPKTSAYVGKTAGAGASTGVTVTVTNQTGGDANVIASQLVH
jgi:hypothetical protein